MPDFTAAYEALLSFDDDGDVCLTSTAEDQWRALDELRRAWGAPLLERLLRLERSDGGSAWLYHHAVFLLGESGARLYAADCAERVLHLYEAAHPNDPRPRRAIEAARAYVRGEATAEDLAAAEAAAEAAAGTAAAISAISARFAAGAVAWAAGTVAWATGAAAISARAAVRTARAAATEYSWQIDHLVACVRALEAGAPWPTVEPTT
jgi:hypothetical protein